MIIPSNYRWDKLKNKVHNFDNNIYISVSYIKKVAVVFVLMPHEKTTTTKM